MAIPADKIRRSEVDRLRAELERVRAELEHERYKNRRLSKENLEYSFQVNPDTSGGAFTEEEIRRYLEWR